MAIESSPVSTTGESGVKIITAGDAHPPLKELLVEASRALACLDADRLEELALSCEALNRDSIPGDPKIRAELARQAKEAASEMAVFERVLEATRANLNVMQRLRDLRAGRLEYGEQTSQGWVRTENSHGNN
jgi:hypothetical protein